jgi:hypothetical protein
MRTRNTISAQLREKKRLDLWFEYDAWLAAEMLQGANDLDVEVVRARELPVVRLDPSEAAKKLYPGMVMAQLLEEFYAATCDVGEG